ncbi:response regulator protein [Caballeronia arvi]|uniref:Response regulator protein n=1 Tax=Caballeronia arvi TaxID=1777135 RepID=A0A158L5R5_9BURK|nr:response regulator [Caballeronia arvi]SAL88687.1 response regulator protein [Caballeronia arvi]
MQSLLIVEDNPRDLDLTLIALESYSDSLAIETARDGEEALAYLRREGRWLRRVGDDPALVLMDLKLPKMDGFDVLQEIRRTPKIALLPVVALTSSCESRDLRRCYESGINAFVVKPMNFGEFSKTLSFVAAFWLRLNRRPSSARTA